MLSDQDLDLTERIRHLAGELTQPVEVPGVRRKDLDLSIDLSGRFPQLLLGAAGDRDPGTLPREHIGDPAPDALAGRHDEGGPALDP